VEPEPIPLEILHETGDLLVINKAPGMVVHPGPGNRNRTLVNALLHRCPDLSGIGGVLRPGIVHRLDKETSGCLVVAKNDRAHRELSRQFAGRSVRKTYLALVRGRPRRKTGTIETRIGRHPVNRKKMAVLPPPRGRVAVTDYRVLQDLEGRSLVECGLRTGRTHQIRVHLNHLGHPILGDRLYGGRAPGFERQMLHAWRLGFRHPGSDEWIELEAPLPDDFLAAGVRPPAT
jgi:23S rRNA pseudouridine1911/1915/1917 synthase